MNERTKQMIISLLSQAELDGENVVNVRDNNFPRHENHTTFRVVTADNQIHHVTLPESFQMREERTLRILIDLSSYEPEDVMKAKVVAGNLGGEYMEALEKRVKELEAQIENGVTLLEQAKEDLKLYIEEDADLTPVNHAQAAIEQALELLRNQVEGSEAR